MIYFVRDGFYVKIGYTAGHHTLRQRVNSLQVGNPRSLKILGIIPGARRGVEAALQRQFNHLAVGGEWFALTDELRSYIRANGKRAWCAKPRHSYPILNPEFDEAGHLIPKGVQNRNA